MRWEPFLLGGGRGSDHREGIHSSLIGTGTFELAEKQTATRLTERLTDLQTKLVIQSRIVAAENIVIYRFVYIYVKRRT